MSKRIKLQFRFLLFPSLCDLYIYCVKAFWGKTELSYIFYYIETIWHTDTLYRRTSATKTQLRKTQATVEIQIH